MMQAPPPPPGFVPLEEFEQQGPRGLLQPGNIDLGARPVVRNPDGSTSTVRSISTKIDGREVLIPTVSDEGQIMGDEEAIAAYLRTGRHLGMFDTPENATGYAQRLHMQQAGQYGPEFSTARWLDPGQTITAVPPPPPGFVPVEAVQASNAAAKGDQMTAVQARIGRVYDALDEVPGQGATDSLVSGRLAGFGDEIGAGATALIDTVASAFNDNDMDFRGAYDAALERERGRLKRFAAESPILAGAAEVLGGVASVPAGAMAVAPTAGARIMQGARQGAGYGALYGAGTAEGGLENRASGAAAGGALGAGVGAAIPAIGAGIGAANRFMRNTLIDPIANVIRGQRNPEAQAENLVTRALQRDQVTPDMIGARLDRAEQAGFSNMVPADIAGENTRRLARSAVNVPGPGRERIVTQTAERQAQQPERVMDQVRKALGDPDSYYGALDDLIATRGRQAKPLYEQAYSQTVPFSRELETLLQREPMKRALREAERMASAEGQPFQSMFANVADDGTVAITRVPDMRAWDVIKRALDDVLDREKTFLPNGEQRLSNYGRAVAQTKRELLEHLDRISPAYAQARRVFSSASDLIDAVAEGRRFTRLDPVEISRKLKTMSDTERDAFRLGVAKGLLDQIERTRDGLDLVKRIFGNAKQRKALQEIFPDTTSFREFRAAMLREAKLQQTREAVRGNSSTAGQIMDLLDNHVDVEILHSIAQGNLTGAVAKGLARAAGAAKGMNERVADRVAEILFSTDPRALQAVAQRLHQKGAQDPTAAVKARLLKGILSRAADRFAVQNAPINAQPPDPQASTIPRGLVGLGSSSAKGILYK